jgi:hypothetical protein
MINLNKKKGEIGQKKRGGSLSDTDDPFLFLFRKKSKQNPARKSRHSSPFAGLSPTNEFVLFHLTTGRI